MNPTAEHGASPSTPSPTAGHPPTVDVVLPVLDEAEAIAWVLERMPDEFRAIVADNGSADGSPDIARRLGATVVDAPQRGFGAACWAGLEAATAEIICFMDCDGSLDPRHLERVVRPVAENRVQLMIGARKADRGAWPPHARIANLVLAQRLRRRSIHLSDLGPMRAMHRKDLLDLGMTDRRSGWPLEMVLRAHSAGWRIDEVDVPYLKRAGKSKVTGTVQGTIRAIKDMNATLRNHPKAG